MSKETEVPKLSYVQECYTQETGGGMVCDVFLLDDGTTLVISEESIVLYEDLMAWEEDPRKQIGTIHRFIDPSLGALSN